MWQVVPKGQMFSVNVVHVPYNYMDSWVAQLKLLCNGVGILKLQGLRQPDLNFTTEKKSN